MATVYHGTTYDRARKIIQGGKILRTTQKIARHSSTRHGYVYVTKNLCDAMDFSSRGEAGKLLNTITVFKIEIDDAELMADPDEEKWKSTIYPSNYIYCFRIKRDLTLINDIKAVYLKRLNSASELGYFLLKMNSTEAVINESEWNYFHENESTSQRLCRFSSKLQQMGGAEYEL